MANCFRFALPKAAPIFCLAELLKERFALEKAGEDMEVDDDDDNDDDDGDTDGDKDNDDDDNACPG